MDSFGLVGNRLDHVQLVKKASARANLSKVLGLIDHNGDWPAMADGLLHRIAIFGSNCP